MADEAQRVTHRFGDTVGEMIVAQDVGQRVSLTASEWLQISRLR